MSIEDCAALVSEESPSRPRRQRHDSLRAISGQNAADRSLGLQGIMAVLNSYDETAGGINCSVCGKLYKSKVCLTKHLWEHSVYWDMFSDEKNQDRVLSIQAALILYSGPHDVLNMGPLLVTSPQEKKAKTPDKRLESTSTKRRLTMKSSTPKKRFRSHSGGSDSGVCSESDSETLASPLVH